MSTRSAAVAGTFYPSDKRELTAMIDKFYSEVSDQPAAGKALIAPHAGYVYSGPIAASCYAPLMKRRNIIKKVILLGPSHYVGFMGMAVPSSDFFETPLGQIEIDKGLYQEALDCEDVITLDNAHLQEHSLEVHLPFLQTSLDKFTLLPVVIGQCEPTLVADLINKLWGGPETLIVVSTDLSHYKNYDEARQSDFETAENIQNFNGNKLDHYDACGCTPIQGLLAAIKGKLGVKLVDLRNSGDTSGDKNRVVGYASFICDTPEKLAHFYSQKEKEELIALARYSIAKLLGISEPKPDCSHFDDNQAATFVTLKLNGELRGCIGTISAHRSLIEDIRHNAKAAAFEDPRFAPLSAAEFNQLEISISILTPPEEFPVDSEADFLEKVTPGVDGLIISDGHNRGTFLPSVWEELPDAKEFLFYLKRKAGLPADYWSPTLKFQKYGSVAFSESEFC